MKACSKCNILKPKTDFYFEKRCGDGFMSQCKECIKKCVAEYRNKHKEWYKEYFSKYQKENREKFNRYTKEWELRNPEYRKEYYEKNKDYILNARSEYRKNNQEKLREAGKEKYQKNKHKYNQRATKRTTIKRQTIPKYNLAHRMSTAVRLSLKNGKNGNKWEGLVGYAVKDLKNHFEKLFTEGMTWEKFLNGEIHIDHVLPISFFSYEKPEDEEFQKCWSLKNLQPLWAEDNLIKSNKIVKGELR